MLSRSRLHMRATFFRSIRQFFYNGDFLEVDTPVRLPLLIPESMIEPVACDGWFLQTSPELCMKRLLAEGNERIFQICPCFRKNEVGRLHSEEFKMLEWYRLDSDYHQLMADCIELLQFLAENLQENEANLLAGEYLQKDWQKLTVKEAFEWFCSISLDEALAENSFDELLVEQVEPHLGISQPTFLYNYPAEQASLARISDTDSSVAERFELYMHGIEIANGFSELTDRVEQHKRFEHEIDHICQIGGWQTQLPDKFLASLDQIETAAGIALGVDRLFMLFLGERTLDRSVPFTLNDLDQ